MDDQPEKFEVFYDGDCPLCLREIRMLQWLDRSQRIRFVDICQINFSESNLGKSYEQLMAEIHGRLPEGSWVTGVEVFRQLYSLVGFRWLMVPTRWPIVSSVLDWAYKIFARNRLKITGRCDEKCRVGEPT